MVNNHWLVVTGTWLLFSINIGNVIIPADFHSFQGGGPTSNQNYIDTIDVYIDDLL